MFALLAPSAMVSSVCTALVADGQPTAIAAAKADVTPTAARRWSKRLKVVGSADDAPRTGRPRATDPLTDAAILRASELDHFALGNDIRHQLALPVSEDTVNRRLDAAGLPSRVAARKRHFTEKQRKKRLSFARGYKHWTAEDWEKVIISDEVTLEGEGRERHVRVRRPAGHRFDPAYTVHSRNASTRRASTSSPASALAVLAIASRTRAGWRANPCAVYCSSPSSRQLLITTRRTLQSRGMSSGGSCMITRRRSKAKRCRPGHTTMQSMCWSGLLTPLISIRSKTSGHACTPSQTSCIPPPKRRSQRLSRLAGWNSHSTSSPTLHRACLRGLQLVLQQMAMP